MSEFTVKLEGKHAGEEVSPLNAPLQELRETLDALSKLIKDTGSTAEPTMLKFRTGSLEIVAHLPTQTAMYLGDVLQNHTRRADEPYMVFLNTLVKTSRKSGLDIKVLRDDVVAASISPKLGVNLTSLQPRWIKTTLTVTGEIVNMGGRNPNIHVVSDHDGETYIIGIDRKTVQELHLYRRYAFDVFADQVLDDGRKLRNLKYRAHLELAERMTLAEFIEQEGSKWADVHDPDAWVANLRGHRGSN